MTETSDEEMSSTELMWVLWLIAFGIVVIGLLSIGWHAIDAQTKTNVQVQRTQQEISKMNAAAANRDAEQAKACQRDYDPLLCQERLGLAHH